jgi:hypothetical protein
VILPTIVDVAPSDASPKPIAWAVVERATGVPAGTVLLKPLPDGAGEIEIGWHLHPDSWGRGLATEAAQPLLARGFAHGLEEIWAVTDPENRRSARVCEKLGTGCSAPRIAGTTSPSLTFWIGAREDRQPTLIPDGPVARPPA